MKANDVWHGFLTPRIVVSNQLVLSVERLITRLDSRKLHSKPYGRGWTHPPYPTTILDIKGG